MQHASMQRVVAVAIALGTLAMAGCVVAPPRPRVAVVASGAVWVPAHWNRGGIWVAGHWRPR